MNYKLLIVSSIRERQLQFAFKVIQFQMPLSEVTVSAKAGSINIMVLYPMIPYWSSEIVISTSVPLINQ